MARYRVMQLGSPTGLYGAERWILALVRHLDAAEVESIVAVIRDEPGLTAPLCANAAALGLRTRIFEAPGRVNWSAVSALRRYLRDNDVQILHTHGYKTDLIGLLATRGTSCRLVCTPHGWSVQAGLALRAYEALDRLIFPFCDAVAPLSESLFADLQGRPGMRSRLQLIINGVDIAEIDETSAIAPPIAQWRQEGQYVIGYIGQLIPRKGLTVLLEAFARLDHPRKRLAIVGEGEQREELQALAAARGLTGEVTFFGFRPDRLAFLKGFDVFVLPSHLEGIPRCLMESMAARVPIIASDIPGCRDLIEQGRTGVLFPMDDVAALTECLSRCASPESRAPLALAARDLVVEKYSASAMALRYQQLYGRLLSGFQGAREQYG